MKFGFRRDDPHVVVHFNYRDCSFLRPFVAKNIGIKKRHQIDGVSLKRGGQDSNLRYPRGYNCLAGSPIQPLWHLPKLYSVFNTEPQK
jgi:hypothetical protein